MSFFQFNFDPNVMKAAEERLKAESPNIPPEGEKPKFYYGADGALIIDDPSLIKEISVEDTPWTLQDLGKISRYVGNVINEDGTVGAWFPLSRFKAYRDAVEPVQTTAAAGQ